MEKRNLERWYRLKLSIERRPLIVQNDTLFLNIDALKANTEYSFEFDGTNFQDRSYTAFLVDKSLGLQTPVSLTVYTVINFKVEGKSASSDTSRFMIVFKSLSTSPLIVTGVKAWQANQNVQIQWDVQSETGVQQYIVEKSADMRQFTTVSSTAARNNNTSATYNSTDLTPFEGDNSYRIKIVQNSGGIKYSNVVKIRLTKGEPSFSVYPNPVTDKTVSLQLVNIPDGAYRLLIYDQSGHQVLNNKINHYGDTSGPLIFLPKSTAPGTYYFVLKSTDNTLTLKQYILVL